MSTTIKAARDVTQGEWIVLDGTEYWIAAVARNTSMGSDAERITFELQRCLTFCGYHTAPWHEAVDVLDADSVAEAQMHAAIRLAGPA